MNVRTMIRELTALEAQGFGETEIVALDADGYIHETVRVEHDAGEGQVVVFVEEA